MARFVKEFNKDDLEKIKTMAAIGLPIPKIAIVMGVSEPTFERMMKHRPAVREAIEAGRAAGTTNVLQTAYSMATSGEHPSMTMFWLKVREGWRETVHLELDTRGGGAKPIMELTREERNERIDRLLKLRAKLFRDVTPVLEASYSEANPKQIRTNSEAPPNDARTTSERDLNGPERDLNDRSEPSSDLDKMMKAFDD